MNNDRYRWQDEALHTARVLDQENFTLVACPGAGKTKWALRLAGEWIQTGVIDRFWVVCPTRRVKKQWAKAASRLGLEVDHTWENDLCGVPADVDGVAVTYATVNNQPHLHRNLVSGRRTLVIFDEIHHLEDNAPWGESCKIAFENAARRLMLSGTPFRTAGRIPFVRYESGYVEPDSHYPYWRAVRENVCRAIYFPRKGGKVEYEFDNQSYTHDFDEALIEREAKRRLRAAIHADFLEISDIAAQLLADANDKLRELRNDGDTRAGGLVIASSISHANAIATHMKRILHLPHTPPVVASDDEDAQNVIDRFEGATEPWIVSVNMISEGVDIPRLKVLVYLTNYLTLLYFLQALGRIARGDGFAYCFMPDDWTLRTYAQKVYNEREQALIEIEKKPHDPSPEGPGPEGPATKKFTFLNSEGTDAGLIFDAHRIDRDEYDEARKHLEKMGWPPPVRHQTIAEFVLARRKAEEPSEEEVPLLKSERKRDLRDEQNAIVQAYCMRTGNKFAFVNHELNQFVGITKLKLATEEQLKKRKERAMQLLKTTEE